MELNGTASANPSSQLLGHTRLQCLPPFFPIQPKLTINVPFFATSHNLRHLSFTIFGLIIAIFGLIICETQFSV